MSKLRLTLQRDDGLVLEVWTSDDEADRTTFVAVAESFGASELTHQKIKEALTSTYWVKDTRTYLIEAMSEEEAEDIYNHNDFDEDWSNHDVEVGFER